MLPPGSVCADFVQCTNASQVPGRRQLLQYPIRGANTHERLIARKELGTPVDNGVDRSALRSFQLALPHFADAPAKVGKPFPIAQVASNVSGNLFPPVRLSARGPPEQVAGMSVPEAAVYQEYGPGGSEHQVGGSRKLSVMETVAEAQTMQPGPDCQFRFGVPPSNTGHHPASGFRTYNISQRPMRPADAEL